ncbi:MAG TPA: phosphomethylpyrimidine synthase ThiC [Deferrisomatales bacterium]|nr:phosphomethylpyrimidine synthase ThiC [Deferrisomatales bacterium]
MTILEAVRAGRVPDDVAAAAHTEGVDPAALAAAIARGDTIVCRNRDRANAVPLAIGKGLRTKVNANIGTSKDQMDPELELEKLRVALQVGADTVMDLSTGGPLAEIRRSILAQCPVPVGTVPLYQAAAEVVADGTRGVYDLTPEDVFRVIEEQAREGVDFFTVHCGITREGVRTLEAHPRLLGVVSRGGAITVSWMKRHGAENPLFEQYDRLLEVCREHEVVLSLGDGFRPGAQADATDRGQIHELMVLGELTQRAWAAGVQVMIEGPGHVPLDQIQANMQLQKRLCHGAPFYVLGPLVTDVAPGYDHITSAIGGAIAAMSGADILCYVTPSEHLCLPNVEDVREGVIAARIAGHAADLAKGVPGARDWDDAMSRARADLDWEKQIELAMDPARARHRREQSHPANGEVCTMCGDLCAYKTYKESREGER